MFLADLLYLIYGILDSNTILFISTIPPCISHTIVISLWYYYKNYCCIKYNKRTKVFLENKDNIITDTVTF